MHTYKQIVEEEGVEPASDSEGNDAKFDKADVAVTTKLVPCPLYPRVILIHHHITSVIGVRSRSTLNILYLWLTGVSKKS